MSNSRKKVPFIKQSTSIRRNKLYNRIFRRKNKERINTYKEPLLMHEVINMYDVRDYKFLCKEDKYYRK